MSTSGKASEIVIVGGGIYGTSLAYQLAKAGRSVTLLEAGEIAGGASGGPGERGVRATGATCARFRFAVWPRNSGANISRPSKAASDFAALAGSRYSTSPMDIASTRCAAEWRRWRRPSPASVRLRRF